MKCPAVLVAFLLLLIELGGCASGSKVQVRNPSGYAQMPRGSVAVLKVTARPMGKPRSYQVAFGIVRTPNAPAAFAELLAQIARQQGGLQVLSPTEVDDRLKAAGLEPTLDPSPEQLEGFAGTLKCASYLTAHVEKWNYRYFLTSSKASVRFVLSCYVPGAEDPLWSAQVEHEVGGLTDREAAIAALKETFRTLKGFRRIPPEWGR